MEILSPAGNPEALKAAIAAGCNAVYLGYTCFSARAGAGNFNDDELAAAIKTAHLYHVKVFVTVNTLVKDSEMEKLLKVVSFLYLSGVDAILVQDLGVLSIIRKCFPDLPIHASTQMAIHNKTGAIWCAKQGIKRVVLARECSLSEIEKVCSVGIETEVFVHGAQCVAVSGQCLMSSFCGGRSGNRGRCAQSCRMNYVYDGSEAAWLSAKDICLLNYISDFEKVGVTSLKIEGRLKRPEYVAQVTKCYAEASNAEIGKAGDKSNSVKLSSDMEKLLQIFNRGGFMDGYAKGCEDADVICQNRNGHSGVYAGKVEWVSDNFAQLRLTVALNDGDELQFRGNHKDEEMIYSGKDVPLLGKTALAKVRLRNGMKIYPGDEVYRLVDNSQLKEMRQLAAPKIPVDMYLQAFAGEKIKLTVSDRNVEAVCFGDKAEKAEKKALTYDSARMSLSKTGDTPFELAELNVYSENAFVSAAALNSLRRNALDMLREKRIADFGAVRKNILASLPEIVRNDCNVMDACIFSTTEQLEYLHQFMKGNMLYIWHPVDFCIEKMRAVLSEFSTPVWLELPSVCQEDTLLSIKNFVDTNADKIKGVLLGSAGQLGIEWKVPFAAGNGIPVMNKYAASFLIEQGCKFVTASQELSETELQTLMKSQLPVIVPSYGRCRLMILHHCPARVKAGLKTGRKNCNMCDINSPESLAGKCLTDRKGCSFPLMREKHPEGCIVNVMNCSVTDNISKVGKYGWKRLFSFYDENKTQIKNVAEIIERGGKMPESTSGHWNNPVE